LVSIIHPWESGMDNSPVWDDALAAVEPGPSVAHLRRDTGFAANEHRPTGPEYDRYVNLVVIFRDNGYRADRLYEISPFRVADIGFNAILQWANQDLQSLLAAIGDAAGAGEVAAMEERTNDAIARCWHEEDGFFYGVDTRNGAVIRKPGIGGLLPLLADPEVISRRLRCAELRSRKAGIRTAALLAWSRLADRQLDADRRIAAQRTPRPGRAHPSRQLGVGRALKFCRIFRPAERSAAGRLQVFVDGCHVSSSRGE
jgi:hypothetical protein